MTATIHRPKGILVTSRSNASTSIKRCLTPSSICGTNDQRTPVLMSTPTLGKLRNLRNYYARRCSPHSIVSPPEQQLKQVHTRVRFQPNVVIREIPSRNDYSRDDKRAMWMPRQELKQLIQKNLAEYAYEGRDWRNALEEDEFCTNEQGQLLHPAELARINQNNKPFLKLRVKKRKINRLCLRRVPFSNKSPELEGDACERNLKRPRIEVDL
ncbi:hypothetical protein ACA910_008592 [Epithemia clementina (nom. ined.)]